MDWLQALREYGIPLVALVGVTWAFISGAVVTKGTHEKIVGDRDKQLADKDKFIEGMNSDRDKQLAQKDADIAALKEANAVLQREVRENMLALGKFQHEQAIQEIQEANKRQRERERKAASLGRDG